MKKLLNLVLTLLFGFIYYYIVLPPINFQSEEFYTFLILVCAVYIGCSILTGAPRVIHDTKDHQTDSVLLCLTAYQYIYEPLKQQIHATLLIFRY